MIQFGKGKLLNLLLNSKKQKLITAFLISSLMVSFFIVSAHAPITNPAIYYIQKLCPPQRLDPARAYDTVSCELLQNVLDTLIFWNDKKPITFTPGTGYSLTSSDYADLDNYAALLCTVVPTRGNGRITDTAEGGTLWRFTINTAATFQPWTDGAGVVHPARAITAADVVYSFRRQMIYDSPYGPTWMWFEPAFGIMGWSTDVGGPFATSSDGTFTNPTNEALAANMITNWCYPVGNDVYFNFTVPRAEGVQKQIFAQTWGGVVHPDWVKEMGGWDGLFTAGWSANYHWKPTKTRSELDQYKDPSVYLGHGSQYASFTQVGARGMVGTGPYKLTSWVATDKIWQIDSYTGYWGGWTGNHVDTVIWQAIGDWSTVDFQFLAGNLDEIENCPTHYSALTTTNAYTPVSGINLAHNISLLYNEAVFFTMNVASSSPYQSYVGYPTHKTGPEPLFFANEHMRRAFAWALNYAQYINQAYLGEAIQQASWWVDGIGDSSFKNTALTLRNLNYVQMQNELNQAVIGGYNVGIEGFETTMPYNIGNDKARLALQMIADAFQTLGTRYKCNVVGLDCPVYAELRNSPSMPVYCSGWLADFNDTDDFARVYMYSAGNFPIRQGPPFPAGQNTIDAQIDAAAVATNPATRAAIYQSLQQAYYDSCISIPLVQPVGRRWTRDVVQGWYFNALFRGDYFYDPPYKISPPLENVDIAAQTIVPGTPLYPVVLLCPQSYYLIIGNGNPAPANQAFTFLLTRLDNNGIIANLYTVVGLRITGPKGETFYTDPTVVPLVPYQAPTVTLWWNGTDPGPIYGNSTGVPWKIGVEVWPTNSNANDTNPGDNIIADGTVIIKTLPGDITNNGFVDIFDAIQLANAFGTNTKSRNWNPYADLNGDGNVDIFDAILLAGNFNKHVP